MSYEPLPGTIPARVIAVLKTLPGDQDLSTAALCDLVGQSDANSMRICMGKAISAGLVKTTKRAGQKTLYWSLGDGTPLPAPPQDEPDDLKDFAPPPPATTAEQMLSAWARPAQVDPVGDEELADALAASSADVPENKPAAPMAASALEHAPLPHFEELFQPDAHLAVLSELRPVQPGPASFTPEPDDFRTALWSNGDLEIRSDGQVMVLSVAKTRKLLHYLEHIEAREVAA